MQYDGNERPGVIVYTEDTEYKLELKEYFHQPIIEGLVVLKTKDGNKAFLAQIAYDPFELKANNYKLEKSTFTGTLLRSEWNDTPIDGSIFYKGKLTHGLSNNDSSELYDPNKRIQGCQTFYLYYSTVVVYPDYSADVIGHTAWVTLCGDDSGGGWGGSGGGGSGGGGCH